MQTSGGNSEHKHSETEHFSRLNEGVISCSSTQSSKLKRQKSYNLSGGGDDRHPGRN